MNAPQTPDNEVVDLSPPKEWLYKCDCPQCRVGAHYNKYIAESYRKRGELNNEVARLRKYIERLEIYSPENEWSRPEWRKLIGSKEENENPETLFKLYQFRLAPELEEPVMEKDIKVSVKQGKCPHGFITGWCDACESAPEWRELGPDEAICEGDERQEYIHGMVWRKCENSIGTLALKWPTLKFRTRRPLPKQELNRELYDEEWNLKPKQQEEKAPNDLHAWMRLQELINKEVAVELKRLFDEVQKLKEGQQ